MKLLTALLCILAINPAQSDTIQKWTDAAGKTHYGDAPPPIEAKQKQRLQLRSNFDPAAYDAAIKRNADLFKQIKQIEKRELAQRKKADKDLDDYYKHLDKKTKASERDKKRRNNARTKERNSTSIKVTRSKSPSSSSPKKATGYKF